MSKSLKIAIILPDSLQRVGLRSLLTDYFSPVEISFFASYNSFLSFEKDFFDFYFILSDIFVVHPDFFLPKRTKTICIINGENWGNESPQSVLSHNDLTISRSRGLTSLQSNLSQEEIVEKLRAIFQESGRLSTPPENSKELSAREKDVLRLIVKGLINKEIADKLYISLNTVLTHRKNITSKLGIKTIPGLTFYAITNGLIQDNEIEF
jgi:Response regulator containing a CheY-like receiver domain and an HTH DNA-binding domain